MSEQVGEPAPKIKPPVPKRSTPAVPPKDVPSQPTVVGQEGHPGGNALAALEAGQHPPLPATPRPPGRYPNVARGMTQDLLDAARLLAVPSLSPDVTLLEGMSAVAASRAVIELQRHPTFTPNPLVGMFIQRSGDNGAVLRAQYDGKAHGGITVRWQDNAFQADPVFLPISDPEITPRDRGVQLGLAVWMIDSIFHGMLVTATNIQWTGNVGRVAIDPGRSQERLFDIIFGRSYHGSNSLWLHQWQNELSGGFLRVTGVYDLHPPDGPTLSGTFSYFDADFRFMGQGALAIEGAESATVEVSRSRSGILTALPKISFDAGWQSHGFDGAFEASFFDGSFEAKTKLALKYPKAAPFIQGDVTVVVTSWEKAWAAAKENDPNPHVTGGIDRVNTSDRGLAMVAFGRLDLNLAPGSPKVGEKKPTLPLVARAMFLVDPAGHITARGILRVPRVYELVPEYKDKYEVRKFSQLLAAEPLYIGLTGEVSVVATLEAWAVVGPFVLRDLIADGTYSTRPDSGSELKLSGVFHASGALGLSALVGIRAAVRIGYGWLSTDVGVTVGLTGDAIVRGYVDARPEIKVEPTTAKLDEAPPKYSIHGELDVAGQALIKLGIGGSIGGAGLGSLSGSIGKEFSLGSGGVRLTIDHVFGSDTLPTVKKDFPGFDAGKLAKSVMGGGSTMPTHERVHGVFEDEKHRRSLVSDTETKMRPPPPDRPFKIEVPFKIRRKPHTLFLDVKPKASVLMMRSDPKRVLEVLDAAKQHVVDRLATETDPELRGVFRAQQDELERLHDPVKEVEAEANALAPEMEHLWEEDLPEVDDIAEDLAEYGERYGDDDISGAAKLLTGPIEETEVGEATPRRYTYLGAERVGTSNEFTGLFDESTGWDWEDFPSGPLTRHPVNQVLELRDASRLEDLQPHGRYRYTGKKTTGARAISGDVENWRNRLERRAVARTDEIENAGGVTRQQARWQAEAEIAQEFADMGYPKHPFHILKVIHLDPSNWECHHIQETSWNGTDKKSNLIYLPWPDEHDPISQWFNDRRDDIKRHLDIEV